MPLILPEGDRRELIQRTYLSNGSIAEVREAVKFNLMRGGYLHVVDKSAEDWEIDWDDQENKEADFSAIDWLYDVLWVSRNSGDAAFSNELDWIENRLVQYSPLFALLRTIKSGSAAAEPVATHIFKVAKNLRTDHMSGEERFVSRMQAVIHDVGKIIALDLGQSEHILTEDFLQMHAFLTSRIWDAYARSREYGEKRALKIGSILGVHHLYELVDRKLLTKEDVKQILPKEDDQFLLFLLSVSDVIAAHPGEYDMDNVRIGTEIGLSRFESNVAMVREIGIIAQFFPVIIEQTILRINRYEVNAADKADRLRKKLAEFIAFLLNLPIVEQVKVFLLEKKNSVPHGVIILLGEQQPEVVA